MISLTVPLIAGENKDIILPNRPSIANVDLVTALEKRKTTREYAARKLSVEDLSAILWAANGVNRPDGKRTSPSAHGKQYIDIYVVTDTGTYLYDPPDYKLKFISDFNSKEKLSAQGHVAKASHVFILVCNVDKLPGGSSGKETRSWAHATAGHIAQNVYLMSAAKGIGTCMVAGIKEQNIREALGGSENLVPLYIMPLGYLKE